MEDTCADCGLPIVWLEPRGIWRTADPKDRRTRTPYVCVANLTGYHSPVETVLYQAEENTSGNPA